MSIYPNAIPTPAQVFDPTDHVDWMKAVEWHKFRDELIAALTELGTNPKGAFADVKARLDALAGGFTDRGDPATYDFVLANLITDWAWRDLDLSGIVPAGAKAVLLLINLADDVANSQIRFRKNGNTNAIVRGIFREHVAVADHFGEVVVACDTDRVIEYRATNTVFDWINIAVMGWWK